MADLKVIVIQSELFSLIYGNKKNQGNYPDSYFFLKITDDVLKQESGFQRAVFEEWKGCKPH
jgi:hypothetical protein